MSDQAGATGADAQTEAQFKADLIALIPHMRAFARTMTGNPAQADDLAQDALAKAWQCRDSFQMGTNMKAWTFMIRGRTSGLIGSCSKSRSQRSGSSTG